MRAENENWGDTVREHLFDQRGAVMVHWLILLNVVVFILGFFFQVDIPRDIYPPGRLDLIQLYGAYSEYTCFHEGELWRLFTYQFLHANLGHIMFNMIALWFFGPVVEERFGHLRFLLYYLFCGVAAALFSSLLGYMGFFDPEWRFIPMVGASGSIYGIMGRVRGAFSARPGAASGPSGQFERAPVRPGRPRHRLRRHYFPVEQRGRGSRTPGRHVRRVHPDIADPVEGKTVLSQAAGRFFLPPFHLALRTPPRR